MTYTYYVTYEASGALYLDAYDADNQRDPLKTYRPHEQYWVKAFVSLDYVTPTFKSDSFSEAFIFIIQKLHDEGRFEQAKVWLEAL